MLRPHPRLDAATLESCALEPIHTPGAIQPHGVLLVLAPGEDRIVGVSDNVEAALGISAEALVGRSLPAARLIEWELPEGEPLAGAGLHASRSARVAGRPFHVLTHQNAQGLGIIELEAPTDLVRHTRALCEAQHLVEALQEADDLGVLLQATARATRKLTGFERAFVYRFHPDGHGEVVAEAREEALPPLLGLHYPASDIPAQARQLYKRNRIRAIANVDARPAGLLMEDGAPLPIDLSSAWLRAVSPLHLEYLRNMGMASSASVSLMRGGELWGLLALHSAVPRVVSVEVRLALDLIGRMASMQVDLRLSAKELFRLDAAHREMAKILEAIQRTESLARGLVERTPNLLGLLETASGAAVHTPTRSAWWAPARPTVSFDA